MQPSSVFLAAASISMRADQLRVLVDAGKFIIRDLMVKFVGIFDK